jgi:hypothetical protein
LIGICTIAVAGKGIFFSAFEGLANFSRAFAAAAIELAEVVGSGSVFIRTSGLLEPSLEPGEGG